MSCGMAKNRPFSFRATHWNIYEWNDMLSLSVLQKCPTGVEAAVKKKQERPWVNCCSWVTDTWQVVTLFSPLSYRLDIFYNNQKKRIFKIQVEAIPNREENMVKAKEVIGSSLQARNSQQQRVAGAPHSSLSRRQGVCNQRWGWEPGRVIPLDDLLAGEWA